MADGDIWMAVLGLAGEDIWRVGIFGWQVAALWFASEDIWRMGIFEWQF